MPDSAVAVPDEDDLIQPHEWDSAVGDIGIEWPASAPSRTGPIPGWSVALYDDEGPVCTVAEFTLHLHASATGLVWADMTMFCTPDGKPILRGDIGSPPIYGTFRFRVTSMRMAAQQDEMDRLRRMLNDPKFREQEALKAARRNAPGPISRR